MDEQVQTTNRKRKSIFERATAKRKADEERAKSRVSIGTAFERWRQLKTLKGLKSDALVAQFLLDCYEKRGTTSSSTLVKQERSSLPLVSTIVPESSAEQADPINITVKLEEDPTFSGEEVKSREPGEEAAAAEEENILSALDHCETRADPMNMDATVKLEEDPTSSVEENTPREPGEEEAAAEEENILSALDHSETSHQLSDLEESESSSEDEDVSSSEERVTEEPESDDPDYTPDCDDFWRPKKLKDGYVRELSLSIMQRKHDKDSKSDEDHSSEDSGSSDETVTPSSHDKRVRPSGEQVKDKSSQPLRLHKKIHKCLACGKIFRHNNHLQRHLLIHSGKKPFKCFICARGFSQRGNLKTHMKVHKGEANWTLLQEKSDPKEAPVTANVCGDCGMDFPEQQQLEKHREIHKKPFSCPDCGKTFKCSKYLKLHFSIHTGDSPFLCRTCGKRFLTAHSLKKHEFRHTGEKNFHCDQCGKSFSQASNLQVHLQSHSGERPHLCAVCGKSYSRAATLKVHLRVHTGETPYVCRICGKSFYYYQGHRQHQLVHDKKPKKQLKPLGRPKQSVQSVNN